MFRYDQATGILTHNGVFIEKGYSGFGVGKNNPIMQDVHNVGPIPRGTYDIGPVFDSEAHGQRVMRLIPREGTETFGRGGFMVHGDSKIAPGCGSHGCLIFPRAIRVLISGSGDERLEVA